MALVVQLDSGLWKAVVRGADGRYHAETDPAKSVVRQWAAIYEALVRSGEPFDRPTKPARPKPSPVVVFHEPEEASGWRTSVDC